jgi:hypothetical protein
MGARAQLAAALKPLLPSKVKLVSIPRSLDGIESRQPVVLLYREKLEKAPNAQGDYLATFALWIITPGIDPQRAEDALDDILDDVILALDGVNFVHWSSAERSTFGDSQAPAYKIDLTVITSKD